MRIAEYKQIDTKIIEEEVFHLAEYDGDELIKEAYTEIVRKEVPVMGMVYRDETEEERIERERFEEEHKEEQKQFELNALKEELASYDYIGTKIAMGVATREQYADKITYTEELRQKIRALEQ